MKAVAYIRVSREDENPENQYFVIKRYCDEHGLECLFFEEIGVSRTEDPFKRPVFSSILKFMEKNNIKILIVESIDRLMAEPTHWDKFVQYTVEHGIKFIPIVDEDVSRAFENVIKVLESLKSSVSSEILKVVIDSQIDSLKNQIETYHNLKLAYAKEYVKDVQYKTKRAMERLKSEGRLYHRPRLIHYVALYLSGKERFSDLTSDDVDKAMEYVRKMLKPYIELKVPIYKMHKIFLQQFYEMYRKYPHAPKSYQSFHRLLKMIKRVKR